MSAVKQALRRWGVHLGFCPLSDFMADNTPSGQWYKCTCGLGEALGLPKNDPDKDGIDNG